MLPTTQRGGSGMEDLTQRQREVLEALRRLHDRHGFAPSLREVAGEVGLASVSSVHAHVVKLTERGLVERRPGQPRTVRRVGAGQRS
jgi:repressor LexA